MQVVSIPKETIIFDPKIRTKCTIPYEGHKYGCPNWNTCAICPPHSKYRPEILETYTTFQLVYVVFQFDKYLEDTRRKHPTWSEKQIRNCLYWQNGLKKTLKETLIKIEYDLLLGCGSGMFGSQSMESAGINVFQTLELNQIPIERYPKTRIILCCLICLNTKSKRLENYGNS